MTTFTMPKPAGYTDADGKAYAIKWVGALPKRTTLYTADALRDVLEQAAKFCEGNQVNISPRRGRIFLPFEYQCAGRHEGMDFAAAIRTMKEQIK